DPDEEAVGKLPLVAQGASAKVHASRADQHFTEPPPRYSEASLVKKMEELGIGRPSTYASILTVLRDRSYVRMEKNRFVPEDKGRLVTIFLEEFFRRYVEYDFTAGLEEKLDEVSDGKLDWKALLREFWADFHPKTEEVLKVSTREVIDALDEALAPFLYPPKADGSDPRTCPNCGSGRLGLKTSRYGPFVGCSNYPECRFTRPIAEGEEKEAAAGDRELGVDPDTGLTVFLKSGRFGAYVQLGDGEKPKRSSLPKGWSAPDMDLEKGLRLLKLPREVGKHPEDSQPILAGIGRYGPFVQHNGVYANLTGPDEVFEVGLNRAVTLLAEKRAGGRGRTESAALKDLGAHPADGQPVRVLSGRYGPYIKHGPTNANVPRGTDPQAVTLEQAVALLAERAAKPSGGKKKPARAAKAATAKAPAKKSPAKKGAAGKKKPAAKTKAAAGG
ncbi:MAG: topoisomerase C-terminal repeat-containing protein, partial [Caulobacterales bacterium]